MASQSWLRGAKEVIFKHGNLRLAGLQFGNPDGEPVLCMHGYLSPCALSLSWSCSPIA